MGQQFKWCSRHPIMKLRNITHVQLASSVRFPFQPCSDQSSSRYPSFWRLVALKPARIEHRMIFCAFSSLTYSLLKKFRCGTVATCFKTVCTALSVARFECRKSREVSPTMHSSGKPCDVLRHRGPATAHMYQNIAP